MRKALITLAFVLAAVAVTTPAKASSFDPNCVVSSVQFGDDTWGRAFFVTCSSGAVYYAYLSGGGSTCPTVSADDVKLYEPIALAAKLAGKSLQVSYTPNTCSGRSSTNIVGLGIQN